MKNIQRFFVPDQDDAYTGTDKPHADPAKEAPAQPDTAITQNESIGNEKSGSFKEALQQWANDDAADTAYDDTRV